MDLPSDCWIVIYPAYINAKKTQAEGRKVPKSKAVDIPQLTEIKDVLISKGFNIETEVNKHYPREQARDHIHSGRVRVKLLNEERNPVNPDYPKRQDILLLACELIPKLKTRQTRSMDVADTAQGNKKRKGKRK